MDNGMTENGLKLPYFEWRTVINLYNTVIGEFFIFYKLSFSVRVIYSASSCFRR